MVKLQWFFGHKCWTTFAVLVVLGASFPADSRAVFIGLKDDFQDGTTQDWAKGPQALNQPESQSGGPLGADDLYVLNQSDGGEDDAAGARMAMLNQSQWTGDYLAAGITSIRVDLNNIAGNPMAFADMTIRLGFWNSQLPQGSGRAVTNETYFLPVGSGWQTVTFSIALNDLIAVGGGDLAAVMSNVTQFRIISAESPTFQGDLIQAQLGVDNITAVPEPGSAAMAIVAGAALALGIAALRRRTP